ncbi:hypothetical protein F0562_002064 [Nyssa sinensis]|uniref:Cyclic nucleotide-binding domain-containing protein n=1 Tax=Nyssa sinensis TaxID=561372 RepID=A0A5J5C8P7_9ASTE|nr:hypothetical protein F0562_002064 [Nyssa sinensis]
MSFVKALMTGGKSRVQDDFELENHQSAKDDDMIELTEKGSREDAIGKTGGCLKTEMLSRVFSEDYEGVKRSILDPRGTVARRWNELFLVAGLVSLFVDPLYLFVPKVSPELCIETGVSLEKVLTNIRSVTDVFYWINIVIQFRTAYIAPSSRVIGRGELVIDPWKIAYRYRLRFLIDLLAALPFPQFLNWTVIPAVHRSASANSMIAIRSIGNNLATTAYIGETIFVNLVAALGLVLLAALVGNMQRYLQSTSVRLEEWRLKRTETEQWMRLRQLPPELSQSVRKYDQYKWVATRGVDEKTVTSSLPKDLQRRVIRHLCLNLVRRVPLFDQMDDQMIDAICERLKPALFTQDTYLFREGDPVKEMLFIIRGHLDSYTTNGGRIGFFNSSRIGPGNFCGEELLTWAIDRPRDILPSSTNTVKAISEVEAFALMAEDLKSVALQFRRLHSKKLINKFRFYSIQWRTWAACYIQAAWRRYKMCKESAQLRSADNSRFDEMDIFVPQPGSGLEVYAARLITNIRMGGSNRFGSDLGSFSSLERPPELDYMSDEE